MLPLRWACSFWFVSEEVGRLCAGSAWRTHFELWHGFVVYAYWRVWGVAVGHSGETFEVQVDRGGEGFVDSLRSGSRDSR